MKPIVSHYFEYRNFYIIDVIADFGDKGDPDSRLLLWLAKFEVKIGKDVENYHNAWERIMNTDRNRRSSHYWLQHIHMEK